MSMLLRGKDATETALTAAGQLWALGHGVDLSAVNEHKSEPYVAGPKALTDLPPYPWKYSKGFWHEAHLMRSNRSPSAPRTDLLGVPEDLQNSLEPKWRNHLRIPENPWIEDHKITGTILYPAAGMLVMAMEGALQTADPMRKMQGFRFCSVGFERGLVVTSGDDATVETRLSLQPHKMIPEQFQFTIFSTVTGSSWTKHCSGTVVLEYAATVGSVRHGVGVTYSSPFALLRHAQTDKYAENYLRQHDLRQMVSRHPLQDAWLAQPPRPALTRRIPLLHPLLLPLVNYRHHRQHSAGQLRRRQYLRGRAGPPRTHPSINTSHQHRRRSGVRLVAFHLGRRVWRPRELPAQVPAWLDESADQPRGVAGRAQGGDEGLDG